MMPRMPPTISARISAAAPSCIETGRPTPEKVGDGEIGKIIARPEIAVQQVVQIVEVLFPDRLVEVIDALEIGLDRRD